jgi:hypothetical protein
LATDADRDNNQQQQSQHSRQSDVGNPLVLVVGEYGALGRQQIGEADPANSDNRQATYRRRPQQGAKPLDRSMSTHSGESLSGKSLHLWPQTR